YGMGYRTGYLGGLLAEERALRDNGTTFTDDAANAARWKRWYRLRIGDPGGVFFIGAMLGMLLPTILMAHAVELSGEQPTTATVPTFVASALDAEYGRGMFYITLFIGVLILFSTQLGIFEAMVRVTTDASHAQQPPAPPPDRGGPAPVLLPVHVHPAGRDLDHLAPRAAGEPRAVVGEHVQPRRADLPVPADLREQPTADNRPP